jgi:SAM-dependent methyltransferase
MTTAETVDQQHFSKYMVEILNAGALNLGLALGYRSGLFEALDAFDTPQEVETIAAKAGLATRYVAEWLGIMVAGRIIELSRSDQGSDLFFLPKDHGAVVARRAGSDNLGVYAQEIPLLTACAMDAVAEAMHTGQGVSYDHYPRFQAFMSELANAKHRQVLISRFLPSVAEGNLVACMQKGIKVCDLGCGEGVAVNLMAQAFPHSQFVGFDIDAHALRKARGEAVQMGLTNIRFEQRDAAALDLGRDWTGTFDYVTAFDAIHDQSRPRQALANVHAILKPDGCFSMIDIAAGSRLAQNIDHAMAPFLYTVSLMHCLPVGLNDDGEGLGMMWGREKAVAMLKEAGFSRVEVRAIPDDPFNLHFYCLKQ